MDAELTPQTRFTMMPPTPGGFVGVSLRPDRIANKLEQFLGDTFEDRALWVQARSDLTPELRSLTLQLIHTLDRGEAHDSAVVEAVPLMIQESLSGGFLDVFGEMGPPRPPVVGDDPEASDRRKRFVALLRMGCAAGSRAEGLEVLGRIEAAKGQLPGLGPNFLGWLYCLAPHVFPPLPTHVIRGAQDALAATGGIVDAARKLWVLADQHAGLIGGDDLGITAAFLAWIGEVGPDALATQTDEHYGFNRLLHDTLMSGAQLEALEAALHERKLLLMSGPPGAGKTFTAMRMARYMAREGGERCTVRAHPGLTRAVMVGDGRTPGHVLRMAHMAQRNPRGSFVLMVDDVDALDVRAVFGEVTAALEFPGERVTLPGGGHFSMPPNLLVIATSQAPFEELLERDYAFYRAFHHAPFAADPAKLATWLQRENSPVKRVDLPQILRNLNALLETRGGMSLGHGYLMVEGLDDEGLNEFWEKSVLPYVRSSLAGRSPDLEAYRLQRLT